MSKRKNKEILESITHTNLLGMNKRGLVALMEKVELAGQRVFYVWLKQHNYNIQPEQMDANLSDGIFKNAIVECKLDETEGGGTKKAYQELYDTVPTRLKNNGERIPFYRIYVELETFLVEVYDCHCLLVEKFDWFDHPEIFKKYFESTDQTYEYDLLDEEVDLVEVIQNIYKVFKVTSKTDAYKFLQKGVIGWFKPFDIKHSNINRLILNNDKMNEKYVQKVQGAFFTPPKYIKVSTQYVLNAINSSKKDGYDDYVIVDRCAGVGNLESQFPEEVFPHFILGTINDAEAFTSNIRFEGVANTYVIDALSKNGVDFYKSEIEKYKQKHHVKRLAVIFLENPPYLQTNSNKEGGVKSTVEKTWVKSKLTTGGEDLDEQFVLSAYMFYDIYAYIHYGPIKIWKTRHLIDKEIVECYLCNKKLFNAQSDSATALIHWTSKDKQYEQITFKSDFDDDFIVKKVYKPISTLFKDDGKENGICVIEARNFSFASPRLTGSLSDGEGYGHKWISKANLLNVLPLFCVSRDEYAERGTMLDKDVDYRVVDTLYKTADGGTRYQKDKKFLQDCLLFSLCTQWNQCSTNCKIWEWGEKTLDASHKNTRIWGIYKYLVTETGLNGLYNIQSFNKLEYGKLWREHNLYPPVNLLINELKNFYAKRIHPKMMKYELLK